MNKFDIRFLIRFSQGDPLFHTCLSSMLCHILGDVEKEENSLVFGQVHVFCPGCPTVPLFEKKLIFVCLSSVKRNSHRKIEDWCLATCVCVSVWELEQKSRGCRKEKWELCRGSQVVHLEAEDRHGFLVPSSSLHPAGRSCSPQGEASSLGEKSMWFFFYSRFLTLNWLPKTWKQLMASTVTYDIMI